MRIAADKVALRHVLDHSGGHVRPESGVVGLAIADHVAVGRQPHEDEILSPDPRRRVAHHPCLHVGNLHLSPPGWAAGVLGICVERSIPSPSRFVHRAWFDRLTMRDICGPLTMKEIYGPRTMRNFRGAMPLVERAPQMSLMVSLSNHARCSGSRGETVSRCGAMRVKRGLCLARRDRSNGAIAPVHPWSSSTISAPFQPVMMAAALVLPVMLLGKIEASMTRRPSIP